MNTPEPARHLRKVPAPGEDDDAPAPPQELNPYALATGLAEAPPHDGRLLAILLGESRLSGMYRIYRRAFALVPSPWRCQFCNAPFHGPGAGVVRWIGLRPSRKNPCICARCIEEAPEGGAVVPLSLLFADLRGYTSVSEQLGPLAVTTLVRRFYTAASGALLSNDALLGQIAGDQVEAIFVPGLAGRHYRRKAVEGARAVLESVGYGSKGGNWLQVGVGIASGEQFVGNVAGGGFKDFAAVGDVTNTAARLTSAADPGEIVVDEETYEEVADDFPHARPRRLELKGKHAPVVAFSIRVGGDGR